MRKLHAARFAHESHVARARLAEREGKIADQAVLRLAATVRTAPPSPPSMRLVGAAETTLQSWLPFFRQVAATFVVPDVAVADTQEQKEDEMEDGGGTVPLPPPLADRVCFDVVFKRNSGNGHEETLSFRTRRAFKSARVWCTAGRAPGAAAAVALRSNVATITPALCAKGALFFAERTCMSDLSAAAVVEFIQTCVWPGLRDDADDNASVSAAGIEYLYLR